jgi:uncharacterized UPF0146 family protein
MNASLFLLFRKKMAEVGIAEYFSMAEALGNNCYDVCSFIFLKKANAGIIRGYRNQDP